MKKEILKKIKELEKENKIKVLFLIESGSRAWKWESEDSDYDVRGVYVQDYLVLDEIRKQIDFLEGDLDIVLWDLQKFLRLIQKSNPSTWEWLSSDIIYIDNSLRNKLIKIFSNEFSKYKLKMHYLSMARQNFNNYIGTNKKTANLKKYVYVLRSIACVLWIEKYNTPPPKDYKKVIKLLPKNIKVFFERVVIKKRKSEKLEGKRNKTADDFIQSFFNKSFEKDQDKFNSNELNKIFKSCISDFS